MTFHVKPCAIPHEGIIPGARGHKKIVVPKGTVIYCVCYGRKMFWAAYLNEQTALTVAKNLCDTAEGRSRRPIKLETLLAWNFKDTIPVRIHREKIA